MKFVILLVLAAGLMSCSPVRSPYFNQKSDSGQKDLLAKKKDGRTEFNNHSSDSNLIEDEEDSNPGKDRASEHQQLHPDTTYVALSPIGKGNLPAPKQSTPGLDEQFREAVEKFDNEEYGLACKDFEQFARALPPGDSLYFEARFYWSECRIIYNEIAIARDILSEIIEDDRCPDSVTEKALVRLGQIFCVLGYESRAEGYFDRLRKEFPASIYIPLANCESVVQ
ncbi:MAG: tetratricopeptide repeat protein [Candidatus Kapaibacterium sp.]